MTRGTLIAGPVQEEQACLKQPSEPRQGGASDKSAGPILSGRGIATYRNAKTISAIVQGNSQSTGLAAYYPDFRTVLVVADGGSTDDTTQMASEPPMPENVKRIITGYHGMVGKGSAVRATYQIAAALEARLASCWMAT